MGKEHKKHKKHKHSKHKHKPKDEGYHVPVVPLKSEMRPKTVALADAAKSIGPILPSKENKSVGTILPPREAKSIGPVLPPSDGHSVSRPSETDSYGPSLPPHLAVQQKRVPGPSLPSDFKIEEKSEPIDDDISGFGPLPAELITSDSEQRLIQEQLELRAEYMKRKFAGEVFFFFMNFLYWTMVDFYF